MIRYRILPEQELVLIVLWGATDAQEIGRASEQLRSDPLFSAGYDALVDDTYLEHPPTGDEIRALAESRVRPTRPDAKLAVVAPADVTYGTSRMHQLLAESHTHPEIGVFRDRGSAIEWLGREAADIESMLDDIKAEG